MGHLDVTNSWSIWAFEYEPKKKKKNGVQVETLANLTWDLDEEESRGQFRRSAGATTRSIQSLLYSILLYSTLFYSALFCFGAEALRDSLCVQGYRSGRKCSIQSNLARCRMRVIRIVWSGAG